MKANTHSTLDIVRKLKVEQLKNTLETKTEDYTKLNEQINYTENESEKSNLQRRSDSLYSELENIAKAIDELTTDIEEPESYVHKSNQKIQESQHQNEQLNKEKEQLNQQLEEAQHQNEQLNKEKEDLNQQFQDIQRKNEKLTNNNQRLSKKLEEVQHQKEQLNKEKEDLNQQLKDIQSQNEQLTKNNEQLNQQLEEAQHQNEPVKKDRKQLNQEREIYIYKLLEYLLKSHKWEEANEETISIMNQFSVRNTRDNWEEIDIQQFPCDVLCKIDQLWKKYSVKYSKNHFGFTVQKIIWEEKRCTNSPHSEEVFGNYVGWHDPDRSKWLSSSDPAFRAKIMHREKYRGILPTLTSNLEFNASLVPHIVKKIESCDCNSFH